MCQTRQHRDVTVSKMLVGCGEVGKIVKIQQNQCPHARDVVTLLGRVVNYGWKIGKDACVKIAGFVRKRMLTISSQSIVHTKGYADSAYNLQQNVEYSNLVTADIAPFFFKEIALLHQDILILYRSRRVDRAAQQVFTCHTGEA